MTTKEAPDIKELARLTVGATAHEHESTGEATSRQVDPFRLEGIKEPVHGVSSDDTSPLTPRLDDLPKELGVLLASVGILGIVLPGIAGAPALIAGGLVLWPETFGKVENWIESRFPEAHCKSMQQLGRFLVDLDRRYPHSGNP